MPQIGTLVVDVAAATSVTIEPDFARKGEARWAALSLPEVGRLTLVYTRRDPDKTSPMVKHHFRWTRPTLKSIVTDPSGPYEPQPIVDYDTVREEIYYVHPRSTVAEREAALYMDSRNDATTVAVVDAIVINGASVY